MSKTKFAHRFTRCMGAQFLERYLRVENQSRKLVLLSTFTGPLDLTQLKGPVKFTRCLVGVFGKNCLNPPFLVKNVSAPLFFTEKKSQGQVKIYRVPWPGPSTGGRRLFFFEKKRVQFRKKIRGGDFLFNKILKSKNSFSQKMHF